MKNITLTKNRARRIAVYSSLLASQKSHGKDQKGIFQIIDHLGYVQIDTISVVERAHHHTLWNRENSYKHEYLDTLLSTERKVFEYWGHAASILPIKDYRFYLPYMEKCQNPTTSWAKKRKEACRDIIKDVINRIKEKGPLGSRDFESAPGKKSNGWWDWKPAKNALELLYSEGRLMVSGRTGFQKSYDLVERVLPDDISREYPTDIESGCFFVKRALQSYGVATKKEICNHIFSADKKSIGMGLSKMKDTGEVVPVKIKSLEKESYFMLKASSGRLMKLKKPVTKLSFLSPFDNLIIQRERIERLFEFDYKLECYLPLSKRKYGYFSLPLLWNDQLIGRMDSKADRKNKTFVVKNLVIEDNFKDIETFLPDLGDALEKFKLANGCSNLVVERVNRKKVRQYLA